MRNVFARARRRFFAVASSFAVFGIAFSASAVPMFLGLGDLPGGNFSSYANGISADGAVVVVGKRSGP